MTYTVYDGSFGDVLPLDLGSTAACTIVWDLEDTEATPQGTKMLLEYTTNYNLFSGGFLFITVSTGEYELGMTTNGSAYETSRLTRPTFGENHRYAIVIDRAAAQAFKVFVDGEQVALTNLASTTLAGNFTADGDLYIMGRAQSSLFAKGVANVPTVYQYAMSDAEAEAASSLTPPVTDLALPETLPALVDTLVLESYTDTDTRNQVAGLTIVGSSIEPDNADPVILPAASATRRDKALWYPDPDLVDGRPT